MIKSLSLHNFKCFADLHLEIGGLTLLTGLNGMGKSSVIQALLLLRQSNEQGFLHTTDFLPQSTNVGLILNGDLISLGTANDVFCEFSEDEDDELHIAIAFNKQANKWRFSYEDANTNVLSLIVDPVKISKSEVEREMKFESWNSEADHENIRQNLENEKRFAKAVQLKSEAIFSNKFQYLQAERYGPRVSFATSDYYVRQKCQIGSHGEYAVHFLSIFGDEQDVLETLRHADAPSEKLRSQVEAWLGEISPGARIETTPNYGTDSVSVRFGYASESIVSRPYRATNVGFGLSYLLPVLVAILSAKPGSLLLLENPEAHLHPRGQSTMGRLMALAAKAGVQIIVETHSDHILNGVRLAIHDQKIEPDLVRVHFFGREEVNGTPRAVVSSPTIDANGRISEWPEGFFDEWDNSLSRLLLPPGFSLN